MNSLGERLKFKRKEFNYSQEEIAEILNINRVTYHGYESNKHKPDIDMLVKLATTLHTTTDFLLDHKIMH